MSMAIPDSPPYVSLIIANENASSRRPYDQTFDRSGNVVDL